MDSLKGPKKALLHIYLATLPCFQQIVFDMDISQSKALGIECTKHARSITKGNPETAGTEWEFEFSPETFNATDEKFVVEICEVVKEA